MSKINTWLYDEEKAERQLNVATTALQCDRRPAENCKRISAKVGQILEKHPETELVLFGEMVLGWYDPLGLPEYHHQISEAIPGKTTNLLSELAKSYGIYLCCGISEATANGYHNSQVLIDPRGEIQAIHRKWNLKSGERQIGYLPGPGPVTITEIKGVKIGLVTCSDAAHPHTMRALIGSDLDLILYSLADDQDENWFMAKAMARLYDAWIVSANRFGTENNYWNGHTVISDPLGNLRTCSLDQEGCLSHTLKFPRDRSKTQKFMRNIFVKLPLFPYIIVNWRILNSYYK